LVSICYFEEENDWWVSKHIKKPIRSTVLSVDWHPDNILLAVGSTDTKARVFSAWIKGVDAKASNPVWGEKLPFGTLCGEFPSNGWVHGVAFSPSGSAVAWVSHDSSVCIANGPNEPVQMIPTQSLPFVTLVFTSENQIIAAGHECLPFVFRKRGQTWELADKLDVSAKKSIQSNTAFSKFEQMDSRAQSSPANDIELNTIHQNTITTLRSYAGDRAQVAKISTTGIDGKLVIWDLIALGVDKLRL
jgi:actin related protein 2/3 complex subunit 1A/1B